MRILAAFVLVVSLSHAEPITLTGDVVDAEGKPVPNARVWLVRGHAYPWDVAELLASSKADDDGHFALADLQVEPDSPAGLTAIMAHADGLAIGYSSTALDGKAVSVVLGEATGREGTVTTPDGPAAGLRVGLAGLVAEGNHADITFLQLPAELTEQFCVRTTQNGSFELPWVAAEDHALLRLFVDTEATIYAYAVSQAPAQTIALPPVRTIRGKVIRGGFPGELTGLRVRVFSGNEPSRVMSTHIATADAAGNFEISALQGQLTAFLLCTERQLTRARSMPSRLGWPPRIRSRPASSCRTPANPCRASLLGSSPHPPRRRGRLSARTPRERSVSARCRVPYISCSTCRRPTT